ncbi:DNA polymerase beta superfamily protein [Rhodovibrio sodomensis]|nr:nucleotidyltransferase domain-containing protein [Rhodovibrio sodomensis]
MTPLVKMIFGSQLFGTATPDSDTDHMGVFVASPREILLGSAPAVVDQSTNKAGANSAGDVDTVWYSLPKFLSMAGQGQTNALDMLFAPRRFYIGEPHPVWEEILANRDRLITRDVAGFLGYCRRQAHTYSVKGPRLHAARAARDLFGQAVERHGPAARVEVIGDLIEQLVERYEFLEITDITNDHGVTVRHLGVCGRQVQYTLKLSTAHEMARKLVADYGRRARRAEQSGGADWKALMHAVRVADEGIELLTEGRITLPRPNADELRAIRRGELTYETVGALIQARLDEVEALMARSDLRLRSEPDRQFIEDLIERVHREAILADAQTSAADESPTTTLAS